MFLEMMLPAGLSVLNLARSFSGINMSSVSYVLDHRVPTRAQSIFKLLSPNKEVTTLDQLREQVRATTATTTIPTGAQPASTGDTHAKQQQQQQPPPFPSPPRPSLTHICFDHAVLGSRLQSSLEFPHNALHATPDLMRQYRDDVVSTLDPLETVSDYVRGVRVNASSVDCIVLIGVRSRSRRFNVSSIASVVSLRTNCTVEVKDMGALSIRDQAAHVSRSRVYIHMSGSGSHHFLWLPPGGVSLVLVHPQLHLGTVGDGGLGGGGFILNELLCYRRPDLLCLTAAVTLNTPQPNQPTPLFDCSVDQVTFGLAMDMIRLHTGRGTFDERDTSL